MKLLKLPLIHSKIIFFFLFFIIISAILLAVYQLRYVKPIKVENFNTTEMSSGAKFIVSVLNKVKANDLPASVALNILYHFSLTCGASSPDLVGFQNTMQSIRNSNLEQRKSDTEVLNNINEELKNFYNPQLPQSPQPPPSPPNLNTTTTATTPPPTSETNGSSLADTSLTTNSINNAPVITSAINNIASDVTTTTTPPIQTSATTESFRNIYKNLQFGNLRKKYSSDL